MRMGSGEGFTMRNFIFCTVPPNIVRAIKSRRLRWAGHVARVEKVEKEFFQNFNRLHLQESDF